MYQETKEISESEEFVSQGVRLRPKAGQISNEWEKSGNFKYKISVHFGSPSVPI